MLKDRGAEIVNTSIPMMLYSLPFHFTLMPAEASSNFARYDGLKYGLQSNEKNSLDSNTELFEYMKKVRSDGFGINVKRRLLVGNFLLSSTRYDDFHQKVIEAQQVRRMLI